jgi:hypothetical protein
MKRPPKHGSKIVLKRHAGSSAAARSLRAETDRLTRHKLQLEIDELSRPWWKKTAYLAVFLPTILTMLTIWQAYRTGVFDAQSKLRQADSELLQVKEIQLGGKVETLQKEESALSAKQAEVQTQSMAVERESKRLTNLKTDIARQIVAEKLKEADAVTQMNARLEEARKQSDKALSDIQSKLVSGDVHFRLNHFRNVPAVPEFRDADGSLSDPMLDDLVKLAEDPGERGNQVRQEIQAELDAKDQPQLSAAGYYILFRSTKDLKWRDALFDMVRAELQDTKTDPQILPLLSRIGMAHWDSSEQGEVATLLYEILTRPDKRNGIESECFLQLWYLVDQGETDHFQLIMSKPTEFFYFINEARDVLSQSEADPLTSNYASFLERIAPQVLLVIEASWLASGTLTSDRAQSVYYDTFDICLHRGLAFNEVKPGESIQQALVENGCRAPSSKAADWKSWISDHQDTVSAWMQPHLVRLRNDPALLKEKLHEFIAPNVK